MNATAAAEQVRKAYRTYETQYGTGEWMTITAITHRTDLRLDQIHDGIRHLVRTENMDVVPDPQPLRLTAEDRANRMEFAGQLVDLIAF